MARESPFEASRRYAREHGLQSGPYGICPICETPILALVRIGEWLVVDPCCHQVVHVRYLRRQFPIGPKKTRHTES